MQLHDLRDIWNAGATAFTALRMNVTDTASASASKLIDLLVGGASVFAVRKDGQVRISDATQVLTLNGSTIESSTMLEINPNGNSVEIEGTLTVKASHVVEGPITAEQVTVTGPVGGGAASFLVTQVSELQVTGNQIILGGIGLTTDGTDLFWNGTKIN